MNFFEEIDVQALQKLFEKKKRLLVEENFIELLQLKNTYPELFIKEKETELNNLIWDYNYIASMPHIQRMMRKDRLNKFIAIDFDEWELKALEKELEKIPIIYAKQVSSLSKIVVQEMLVRTMSLYRQKYETMELSDIFPYLGLLVIRIIQLCPAKRRTKMIESALLKLQYNQNEYTNIESTTWKNTIFFEEMHNQIENAYEEIIFSIIKKFDSRAGFYDDLLLFWLIHTTEYIALLAPHINPENGIKTIVDLIFKANIESVLEN